MKKEAKVIFHIDLNAFYASCAMISEPYLKGRVFVVGGRGSSRRGIICTASYEARKYGIRSAMNIKEAMDLFPKVLVVPLDFGLYRKKSNEFFNLVKEYSNIVLKGSIDEVYVDVTELAKKKNPIELAKEIQDRLLNELKLPSSIGIGPTLFLAKMGSDFKKPMGITVLRKNNLTKTLFKLPISEMFGIGRKTYPKLQKVGIKTIGDFYKEENKEAILKEISPQIYRDYINNITGDSNNIVNPERFLVPKSISNETTLNYDRDDYNEILEYIHTLMDEIYEKMIRKEMIGKNFGIKYKDNEFNVYSKSIGLNDFTDDYIIIKNTIDTVFEASYNGTPLRLIGVFFNNLILKKNYKEEYNLFNYQEKIATKEN